MHVCMECGGLFRTPVHIDFVYSTETLPDGTKVTHSEPRTVSACCEAEFEPCGDDDRTDVALAT
jgi:hypothetical protein